MKYLLDNGLDPKATSIDGWTPLHQLVRKEVKLVHVQLTEIHMLFP